MGEKGENMTPETVSLPPTYAPSETYTESPPPAYEKARASWVQVARMVCMTVLAAAFLIGFFILTSAWLQARNACDCQAHQVDGPIRSASFAGEAPRQEQLVGKVLLDKSEGLSLDMNNNLVDDKGSEEESAEEQVEEKKQQPEDDRVDFEDEEQDKVLVPEQEMEVLDEILEEEAEMEEERKQLEEEMRAQMQEMRKRIQLPANLLLGNPMLAGRDVNCEVERRQQQLAPGIVSKIIVVTCDNDDDDDDDSEEVPQILQAPSPLEGRLMPPMLRPAPEVVPSGPKRLGPPFSILAPILKMIAARENAKNNARTPVPLEPIASMPRTLPEPMVRLPVGPIPNKPVAALPIENRVRELPAPSRIPIPFGPLRLISGAPRMINMPLMPEPRRRDGPIITPQGPMPMPRGPMRLQNLVPLRMLPEPLLPLQPRPMPEARGRALASSPVNLPPFNLRLLNLPLPSFMKPKMELRPRIMPITHMEMMRPHHHQEEEEVEELQQPFQPPQFLRVPPPPQRFDPEGRHGIITEIEPDAEIIHSGPRQENPMQPHMHPGFQAPHSHPEPHPHHHMQPQPQPQPQPPHHSHPEILLPPPPPFPHPEHQPNSHMSIENHHDQPHHEGPMAHPPLLLEQPPHPLLIHKAQPTITFIHPPPMPQEKSSSPPSIPHAAPSHTKIIHEPSTHAIIHQGPPQPPQMIHEAPSHTQVIHEPPSHTQVIHEEPPQSQPIHKEPSLPQIIHMPPPPPPSHPQMIHDMPTHPMIHGPPVPPPMPHEALSHPPLLHDAVPQPPVMHDAPPQQPEGQLASLERRAADDTNKHTLLVLN